MKSTARIKNLVEAVMQKTGYIFLDLKSASQYLCDCFSGAVGNDTITKYDTNEQFSTVNTMKSILNKANAKTGIQHADITSALQTLINGYSVETPLYSFGVTSDLHIQYATGYTDFQRALNYFDRKNIPFSCVCGDLTWAGTMVNADQYTSDWKGGMQDYCDIVGSRTNVYAIGGNHECYTATYDTSTAKWTSVDNGIDTESFETYTGCKLFYTISSETDSDTNVYNATMPTTDVFVMLSIKKASAPNLWLDGEFEWLQSTLEANKNKRCYVFFHEHDNADLTADPARVYPYGISESSAQGKAFIDLMREYQNTIWFHGHTHTTFEVDYYSIANQTARGYKSVNIPSLQGPRKYDETTGSFVGMSEKSEGYIIDVYENYIILNALDFTSVNTDGTGEATVIEKYVLDTTLQEIT